MRKTLISVIAAALMLAAAIGLTSCSSGTNYEELDKMGYTVSVKFDAGGGTIKGSDSTVIDVFNPDDYQADGNGNISIPLLAPNDERRDKNNILTVARAEHFLAGWYRERTPIDENDLSKGYTYSGLWSFDNDSLTIPKSGEYTSAEPQITLYAAWIPYYSFEIYTVDENGGTSLLDTKKGINFAIPSWGNDDVTIDMEKFPKRDGYTLDSVYLDADCTQLAEDSVTGGYNTVTGTVTIPTVRLYTTWFEGKYYKIHKADDLRKHADLNGHYEILADLDFTGVSWAGVFKNGKFKGTIEGNGHTISNISISSERGKSLGVFAEISADAEISNLRFENITHVIDTGLVTTGAMYGLLAGSISSDATLTDVSVGGKILIGDKCQNLKDKGSSYTIGLLSGEGNLAGIDTSGITCEKQNPTNQALTFTISVDEDGIVTLVFPSN